MSAFTKKLIYFYPITLTSLGILIHFLALLGISISDAPTWLHWLMLTVDSLVVIGLLLRNFLGFWLAILLYLQQVVFQGYWAIQGFRFEWPSRWLQTGTVALCLLSLFTLIRFKSLFLKHQASSAP